ncbi:unnamed protein product [Urochloa humidicola]
MLPTTQKKAVHNPASTSKAAVVKDGIVGDDLGRRRKEAASVVVAEAAVDVCLAAAAVAGAALLAWWAVAFHPAYAHLWMVPVGLVLACTPPVVCLALRFSGDGRGKAGSAGAPPLAAVVVEIK